MTKASDLLTIVLSLLSGIGQLRQRKMFGGTYIYCDDLFIATVHDGILYFKANKNTAQEAIDQGLRPFSYPKQGEIVTLQYYQAPAEVFSSRAAMQRWASKALVAASQDASSKKPRKTRSRSVSNVPKMKRVAVFGNAGGGKSTLARQLARITRLTLHSLDSIKYKPGGAEVPHNEYLQIHSELIRGDEWIIDGFGCVPSAWERFSVADTLIYVDLPLFTHYVWATKRLVKGLIVTPEGWPENSPIWRGTLNSYRVLRLCDEKLTPKYRQLVAEQATHKRVHHLRSASAIKAFIGAVTNEYSGIR